MKIEYRLVLVVAGVLASGGATTVKAADSCAILSSGDAANMAIDSPDEFQKLSAQCRDSKRSATASAKPAPAASGTQRSAGKAPQASISSASSQKEEPKGLPPNCGFVFYQAEVPNGTHTFGENFCQGGKIVRCESTKPPSKEWVQLDASCDDDPTKGNVYIKELNAKNIRDTLQKMNSD
ncbi:hypothetical protein A6V36_29650 [Paraburkholderia ginsengiterrae]|uniref:Uncharacterized protein n=1 Tax=Paraburkholderia ginsengiterrae TaxID=1462993 RepID=A0A1A9NBE6_9BURK|nr:hypothetical protein [Paraburkholderia ginsengiterrae]OAJ58727.1 hypothetical protein A6V36_29650 [Paraburkholderia ginsengiterrae]OAJ63630.1 hypothetical protein A6V37_20065 [Paraburkholderia ginsengiterrae]